MSNRKVNKKKLYRIDKNRMIGGVAAGFAEYFDMDITMMRALFLLCLVFSGGTAILAYIVLYVIMPQH